MLLYIYKIQDKIAIPKMMPIIPNSLYICSDNDLRYQSINLSYNSLGIIKKITPSMTAMNPMNLRNHGILVADAERIKRIPNTNGKAERIF